jgi:hypothetical protein
MKDLDKEHYNWLKEKYDFLVETILGSDYYTLSIHVFDADVEAFGHMIKEIGRVKYNLKMWRITAIVMTIISVILVIFK